MLFMTFLVGIFILPYLSRKYKAFLQIAALKFPYVQISADRGYLHGMGSRSKLPFRVFPFLVKGQRIVEECPALAAGGTEPEAEIRRPGNAKSTAPLVVEMSRSPVRSSRKTRMSPETEWALPKEPALETVSSPLVVLMRKLPARLPTRISPEVLSASKSPSPSSSRISPLVVDSVMLPVTCPSVMSPLVVDVRRGPSRADTRISPLVEDIFVSPGPAPP